VEKEKEFERRLRMNFLVTNRGASEEIDLTRRIFADYPVI